MGAARYIAHTVKNAGNRRLTIAPRHPRVLHAGPRVRLMEIMLLVHVAIGFLALFVAWICISSGDHMTAGLLGMGTAALLIFDLSRLSKLRVIRNLTIHGLIVQGEIVSAVPSRFTRAHRADGALPRGSLLLRPGLEVTYAFEDERGRTLTGRFLVSTEDIPHYQVGQRHEIYFIEDRPEINASSLVIRWYWRLGGPAMTDEAPPEDFPMDEDAVYEEIP